MVSTISIQERYYSMYVSFIVLVEDCFGKIIVFQPYYQESKLNYLKQKICEVTIFIFFDKFPSVNSLHGNTIVLRRI